MKFFSSLITILLVSATWCLSAKRKTQSDKRVSAREEVTGNNLRNDGRNEESRNVTKLYDTVHKYHGKRKKAFSAKRQYLGPLHGLQSILSNSKNKNGLNGLPTGEVGAHADDPNTAYLDAAHGVSAAVHAQKLQVGSQPEAAHHPFEEGLSPLPIYHKRQPVLSADHPSPIHTLDGQHIGSAHHIATDQTVAAAPQDAAISAVNLPLAQGHVHHDDHFITNAAATPVTGNDASVLDQLHRLDGTSLINEIHNQDLSLLTHPIQDHVHAIHDYANDHDVGHHTADYLGGAEVQHALAHQVPYEIQRPPIHVTKAHHHTSYEIVHDEGEVKYHPCLNGGVYVSTGYTSYECICPEQFIGKNCQDTNHCHPCPCKNKGRCHNIVDLPKYKCTCLPGFYGPQCENKNPCHPNPCKNNGVCSHDGKGNIECVCPSRFKGEKCEELHNCKPNPCQNEGNCIELEGKGKFECQCTSQWRGTICNRPRFCNQNPCVNGGTCQESHDTFNCICVHGWRGRICNDRACKPNPCKNGATCTETEDGKDFKCVCLPWHAGRLCEENRPCLTNPCLNGGKCIDSFSGFHWAYGPLQFYCICRPPYQGEKCEIHGCRNCHKNAHCEVDKCVCDEGYRGNGRICIKKEDPCHPNPCRNDGICVQRGDSAEYDCQCKKPYLPPLCKTKDQCDPNPCKNEGVCTQTPDGGYTCTCPAGTKGNDCEKIDPCLPNPCQHGGTCREENGTATCECKGFWAKPLCKECSCQNKKVEGSPEITCDSEGKCVCPAGWIIDTFDKVCKKDTGGGGSGCDDKPCVNGGECIAQGTKDYICKCKPPYVGKNCETTDVCNPNPCKNNGTCKQDQNDKGKFLGCNCPNGFSVQPYCDKDPGGGGTGDKEDPCKPNPCKNEGQCVKNGKSYDCICKIRFTGPQCAVDKCANCDTNANCVNGRCKCKAGFIGNGYECIKDVPTCEQKCPQFSTCVIPTGNCQCNQGYTFVDQICLPIADESEETTSEETTDETTDIKPTVKPTEPTGTVTQPATTAAPVTTSAPQTTSSGGGGGGPATVNTTPGGPVTPTKPAGEEMGRIDPNAGSSSSGGKPPASPGGGGTPKPAGPPASAGAKPEGQGAAPGPPGSSPSGSGGPPSGPAGAPSTSGGGAPSGPAGSPSSSGGEKPSSPAGAPSSSGGGAPSGPAGSPSSSGGEKPSSPAGAPSSSGGGAPSAPSGSPSSSSGEKPSSPAGAPSSSGGPPGGPSSSGGGSPSGPAGPASSSGGPPGGPSSSGGPPGGPSSSGSGSPSGPAGPASGSSSGGPPGNPDSVKSFIKRKKSQKLSRFHIGSMKNKDSEFEMYRR